MQSSLLRRPTLTRIGKKNRDQHIAIRGSNLPSSNHFDSKNSLSSFKRKKSLENPASKTNIGTEKENSKKRDESDRKICSPGLLDESSSPNPVFSSTLHQVEHNDSMMEPFEAKLQSRDKQLSLKFEEPFQDTRLHQKSTIICPQSEDITLGKKLSEAHAAIETVDITPNNLDSRLFSADPKPAQPETRLDCCASPEVDSRPPRICRLRWPGVSSKQIHCTPNTPKNSRSLTAATPWVVPVDRAKPIVLEAGDNIPLKRIDIQKKSIGPQSFQSNDKQFMMLRNGKKGQ